MASIPLVPVSPLVKTSQECKTSFAEATQRLSQAKQETNPRVDVSTLRRLLEDTQVERHRLDTVEQQMEAVESATAFHWDPDVLARQIAIVNAQLYSRVILDKQLLCGPVDKRMRQTHLVHLQDFHRYLTNSFAHQLIYWSELTPASAVVPTVHPKDNLVVHLVRVAYLLVHVYRDFSGFASVMKALMLPEVRRLRRLWYPCPTRTRDMYRDLAHLLSPSKNYQAYHDMLHRKLNLLYNNGAKVMMAIPWIQPHLASIHSIIKEYTAGDRVSVSAVLSAPGARKLSGVVAILELCQQSITTELPVDELLQQQQDGSKNESELERRKSKRMSIKPVHIEGLRSPAIVPPSDLVRMAPGDLQTYHWLVSRAYLTKDQLIEESIQVESLAPGESLACDVDEDEMEMIQEHDHVEEDAAIFSVPATPIVARSRRPSIDTKPDPVVTMTDNDPSQDTKNDDDDDDDDQGDMAELVVDTTHSTVPEITHQEENTTTTTQPMEVEEEEEQVQDLQNVWSEHKPQEEEEEEKNDTNAISAPVPIAGKSHSVMTSSTQQDSSTSKQTKKSRLSPTAPEFVPTTKLSTSAAAASTVTTNPAIAPSSVVVSPASSAPEEQADEQENDDSEEEWHGYLYHLENKNTNDTESETWNGYPSPPLESTTPGRRGSSTPSEDSEVWKGYHASKMEDDWQKEIDRKVQDCDWQGYTLETLNEDELDSSTMMDGEFEKSRQARRKDDAIDAFRRMQQDRWSNQHQLHP
ncbi:hypothetical protein K492DRAFT_170958 [Lichtheimia hyalospora FSU 10163]|nr:hypothetical protein K492DRAFT_170958 [Lichtheimia hyalospora FSU 10163]